MVVRVCCLLLCVGVCVSLLCGCGCFLVGYGRVSLCLSFSMWFMLRCKCVSIVCACLIMSELD